MNWKRNINEIEKERNKNIKKKPEFKYQKPDAWLIPSHTQKSEQVI
jgi:hypothetical protein